MNRISSRKTELRSQVWEQLTAAGAARSPLPVKGRIPNFVGAEQAAAKLRQLPGFPSWQVVFCNPDSPQKPVRHLLLTAGKRVVMATPRLRAGFLILNPQQIPSNRLKWAATIRGAFALGQQVAQPPEPFDAKITGCVAVDRKGGRLGKGGGYSDLEYAILSELGRVTNQTPILTTVHNLQVSSNILPMTAHDVPVDIVATPTEVFHTKTRYPRPEGIDWKLIPTKRRKQIKWPPTLQPPD
jgi:5-formyltetrahydrofolate cyclo-ligase